MHVPGGVNLLANTSVVAIGILARPHHLALRTGGHPQRGPDPGPDAVRPVHVRPAPPLGHLGTGRLRRRTVLRILAADPGHPQRCPPDAGDGRDSPPDRGLPGRAAVPAATASGADRDRPRTAVGGAVLHRHRGARHHGDDGGDRHRHRRRVRGLASTGRASPARSSSGGGPGGRIGGGVCVAGHPGVVRAVRARPLRKLDLARYLRRHRTQPTHDLQPVLQPQRTTSWPPSTIESSVAIRGGFFRISTSGRPWPSCSSEVRLCGDAIVGCGCSAPSP